jgi:hypothetical protein
MRYSRRQAVLLHYKDLFVNDKRNNDLGYTKLINALCEQNANLINVKVRVTYSYREYIRRFIAQSYIRKCTMFQYVLYIYMLFKQFLYYEENSAEEFEVTGKDN